MRAVEVFPVPRGPVNKNAWENLPCSIEFCSVFEMWPCPTRSENVWLRYFL
jgi:hypothetical protein